jgi:hypothetical protein
MLHCNILDSGTAVQPRRAMFREGVDCAQRKAFRCAWCVSKSLTGSCVSYQRPCPLTVFVWQDRWYPIDFARGRPTNPARIPVGPVGRWYQSTYQAEDSEPDLEAPERRGTRPRGAPD